MEQREWVLAVLDGAFIQATVVDTQAVASAWFLNEQDGSTCGRPGGLDESLGQIVLQPLP